VSLDVVEVRDSLLEMVRAAIEAHR
jgi:hypothetical protein